MDFKLSEEKLALQDSVRKFAQEELLPGVIERDDKCEFCVEGYKKMGQMGLIGLPYPEEFGGQGSDYLSYAIAVEEISKVDASTGIAFSVSTSLYAGGVAASAVMPNEKKKEMLENVLTGKSFGAFSLTEPNAGSDVSGGQTTAVQDGDNWILNGQKIFCTNGPLADYFVVYANGDMSLGAKGMCAFVVQKGTPGLTVGRIEDKMGIRSAQVAEINIENVVVPAENMVAAVGKGFGLAMKSLDGGRIGVAAQGLGIAEGAFEIAKEYLKTRVQFGKPLYKNQYISFKMAELAMEIESAKYMLYKAALDKDNGEPYSVSAAKAKYLCSTAAMHVTTEAVQLLGGNGYMKGYHVERMMRDAKITQIYEGTSEIQKMIIGGSLFA